MTIIKIGLPATVATLKRRRAASLMLLDVFPIITLLPLFPPITTSSSPPTIFSISPILVCLCVSRSSSLTSYQTSPANQTQGYLPPRHSCQPSTTSSFPLTFPLFPLTPTNPISPLFFAPFFPPTNSLSFPFSLLLLPGQLQPLILLILVDASFHLGQSLQQGNFTFSQKFYIEH